ncbi:MAG: Fe-S cluster assembly protein SufD [Bacteroidetes bacterium]|nr:Fe-S cluster assembly protein SufD [Bacteroidota bacterium]
MNVIEKMSSTEKLVSEFQRVKSSLKGFLSLREKAISEFERVGIPNRKNEEWKYSDASALFKSEFNVEGLKLKVGKHDIDKFLVPNLNASVVVLVNGIYSEELSSLENIPKGVVISSFAQALAEKPEIVATHFSKYADTTNDAFVALNTAFASDGVFISVPDNTIVKNPIHIINIISVGLPLVKGDKEGFLIQPRFLFIIGNNSELKIVESFDASSSQAKNVCNSVAEISIGEKSKVQYYKLQNDCTGVHLISSVNAHQQKESHFDTNTITLNGDWVRNNLNIVPDAEHCETHLNGLFITCGNQHVDNHTLLDHRKPNCESNQLYKGILDEKSIGIFNGKIFVRRDAQKTNAYQSSKNILLSDDATINTKPQLEIYADDVKCSHGSTTGQLNEDAMFYLRSRGLSENSARNLLLFAFAGDVIEEIQIEPLKIYLAELVNQRLKK